MVGQLGLSDGMHVAGGRTAAVPQGHAVGATDDPVECAANDPAVLGYPRLVTGDGLLHEAWTTVGVLGGPGFIDHLEVATLAPSELDS